MRERGGGRIINILNIGAKQPGSASAPTTVSRAAGLALTKVMSKEYAADGILVNAVLIGLVKSDQWERRWRDAGGSETLEQVYERMGAMVPVGRIADADELADLVTFLASDRARYVTGSAINFDGGQSAVV
jgi:NAD(P)-dependent dehydrogenase (short-subunit alcohol dehydrogenase family)